MNAAMDKGGFLFVSVSFYLRGLADGQVDSPNSGRFVFFATASRSNVGVC